MEKFMGRPIANDVIAIRLAALGDQNPERYEHISTVDIVTALREQVDAILGPGREG